jgi:hypothetical protein
LTVEFEYILDARGTLSYLVPNNPPMAQHCKSYQLSSRPAKLNPRRASAVRQVWDRLLDFTVATGFGELTLLVRPPEMAVDRAIREQRERPRKAVQ